MLNFRYIELQAVPVWGGVIKRTTPLFWACMSRQIQWLLSLVESNTAISHTILVA